jgi:hypothetical protein
MLALSPSRFRFFGRRRTRAAVPLPYRIAGLSADYNAAIGVTTTPAKVSAWNDATGNSNNLAQATDGNRPTYVASSEYFRGWPAIRFVKASTTYLFGSSLPICTALSGSDKPFTVFAVVRRATKISADEYLWTLGNSAQAAQSYISGGYRYQNNNSQRVNSDVRDDAGTAATNSTGMNEITDFGPQVLCWSFSGTVASIYVVGASQNLRYDALPNTNGTSSDYSAQGTISFNRWSIGAQLRSTASRPCDVDVARVLVYNRELTADERSLVSDYLAGRYIRGEIESPADLPGLANWWDAAQLTATVGAKHNTLPDAAGGKHFVSPSGAGEGFDAAWPTVRLDVSGNRYLQFGGSQVMFAGVPSDWTKLHNGTDRTIAVVFRVPGNASALTPILDTVVNNITANAGLGLYHDAASDAQRIQWRVGAVSATPVLSHDSRNYGARQGQWHVALLAHEGTVPSSEENFHLWLDNERYAGTDQGTTPSAANPPGNLALGALADASVYGDVDIGEVIVYDRKLGEPGEAQLLCEHLAAKWNTAHFALAAGNGLANTLNDATPHRGFPGLLRTPGGVWLCTYRRAPNHGSSAGECVMVTSSDAIRWSAERVIYSDTTNYDWRGTNFLGQFSTGRIFIGMKLSTTSSGLLPYTASVLYSDDNGGTWHGPMFISKVTDSWHLGIFAGGLQYDEAVNSIVELGDGTLLLHFMALVNSAVFPHILQCKSFDGGDTWTEPVPIYYGRQPGLGDFPVDERIQEPIVVRFANGELLMAIRADTANERIYFVRDVTGTGDHWLPSQPTVNDRIDGWGNPRMIVDENERVWLFYRSTSELPVYSYSDDRGDSWSAPQPLTNLSTGGTTTIAAYGGMSYAFPARDENGNIFVAFGLEAGSDSDIFVRRWGR